MRDECPKCGRPCVLRRCARCGRQRCQRCHWIKADKYVCFECMKEETGNHPLAAAR